MKTAVPRHKNEKSAVFTKQILNKVRFIRYLVATKNVSERKQARLLPKTSGLRAL
jgi:hypothetical protein